MTTVRPSPLEEKVFQDYKIQIEAIVQKSFAQLQKRFPDHSSLDDYDILLRAFTPIIDIINFRIQEQHLGQILRCVVHEEFGYESPSEILFYQRMNGKRPGSKEYKQEVSFLQTLKAIPFTQEVLRAMNNRTFEEWYSDEDAVQQFFSSLQDRYPQVFSFFSLEDTKHQLKEIMHSTYERRKRGEVLKQWMHSHWKDYQSFFSSSLEAKLFSLVMWKETEAEAWHKDHASDLRGMQKVIVVEIVPKGLPSYHGPVGGKTVKIGDYKDINTTFLSSQAYLLSSLGDFSLFEDARESFLLMLIARRYIYREAVDLLLDYKKKQLHEDFSTLENHYHFRRIIYKTFHYHADDFLQKFSAVYDLNENSLLFDKQ